MGPDEHKEDTILYFKTKDHDYVQIPAKIVNFTFEEWVDHMIEEDEEAYKRAMTIRSIDSFTFTVHIRKKVSAKRFKKILMSKGFSRNDADFLCYIIGNYKGKISFRDVYLNTMFLNLSIRYCDVLTYIVIKGEAK